MEREKLKNGNETIAAFLGWFQDEDQDGVWFEKGEFAIYVAYSIHRNHPHYDLPFARSMEYLYPVYQKICQIMKTEKDDRAHTLYANARHQIAEGKEIEECWENIVTFIEYYNTIKK